MSSVTGIYFRRDLHLLIPFDVVLGNLLPIHFLALFIIDRPPIQRELQKITSQFMYNVVNVTVQMVNNKLKRNEFIKYFG